jgi:hypothetical protein
MWKSISLSFIEYKELTQTIQEFLQDEIKLRQLQETGHFPLILANYDQRTYSVTLAPQTLDVLCEIDDRFTDYQAEAQIAPFDVYIIDSPTDCCWGIKNALRNMY